MAVNAIGRHSISKNTKSGRVEEELDTRHQIMIIMITAPSETVLNNIRSRPNLFVKNWAIQNYFPCGIINNRAPHFLDFYFCSLFVVMKKILLDSPFSYHLFVCYLHHLHQTTPPIIPFFCVLPPAKTAPDIFFRSYPYYQAKGSDNVYMFHYIPSPSR